MNVEYRAALIPGINALGIWPMHPGLEDAWRCWRGVHHFLSQLQEWMIEDQTERHRGFVVVTTKGGVGERVGGLV